MNTEQIMTLATLAAESSHGFLPLRESRKNALRSAVEALVQERDVLQNEVYARNGDVVNLMSERDALTLDLQTERCAVVAMQAERDALKVEIIPMKQLCSDVQPVLRAAKLALDNTIADRDTYQREADKLAAENKVLRDALQLFAEALPKSRDTIKTCYGITNSMRDAAWAALERKQS